jgi:hypothetical protein
MPRKYLTILLAIPLLFCPVLLHAEEPGPVIQTIEQAIEEYNNNDFSNAANSLDYASQLIRQKKGEALDGWTADDGRS